MTKYNVPNYRRVDVSNLSASENPIVPAPPGAAELLGRIRSDEDKSPPPMDVGANLTERARERLFKLAAAVDSLKATDHAGWNAREGAKEKFNERRGHRQSVEQRHAAEGGYQSEIDKAIYSEKLAEAAYRNQMAAGDEVRAALHRLNPVYTAAFRYARSAKPGLTDYKAKGKRGIETIRAEIASVRDAIRQHDEAPESLNSALRRVGREIDMKAAAGQPHVYLSRKYLRRGNGRPDGIRQLVEWSLPTRPADMLYRREGYRPDEIMPEVIDSEAVACYLGGDALRASILEGVRLAYAGIEFSIDPAEAKVAIQQLRAGLLTLELEECSAVWLADADYPDFRMDADPRAVLGLI